MIDPYRSPWESWLQKWFVRLLVPAILVNAGGLFISILEPDGALYATIAKTIALTGDFVNLRVEGRDWLDKPHFPFWMAALSFRVFGINGFAYKLPALLFWGAGAWYTYRFANTIYGKAIAQLSTLVYVSAAHLVISNNDVRAEPYLTGLVIGSVFHFYQASRVRTSLAPSRWAAPVTFVGASSLAPPRLSSIRSLAAASSPASLGWSWHLVAGSFLAACAMMTKGPFVLITIAAGFILDWILGKQWEQFRSIRWWIALALIGLFITPELYCLYVQFDLHPEKQVFGHTGVSGIRFFFWDSQFGRFFNTGPIKGSGDPFFYFHTVLWAFLPWSLLLYAAIVKKFRTRKAIHGDAICLGAAVASFIVFSLSRFQLPHYLNILFPFFSILTAAYIYNLHRSVTQKIIGIMQGVICGVLAALLLFLCWTFHFNYWPLVMISLLLLTLLAFFAFRGRELTATTGRSFSVALVAYGFINFGLYPAMLRYQAGTEAGNYIGRLEAPVNGKAESRTRAEPESPSLGRTTEQTPGQIPGQTPGDIPGQTTRHIPGQTMQQTPGQTTAQTIQQIPAQTVYTLQETPANYSFEFYSPLPVKRLPLDDLLALAKNGPALAFLPSAYADTIAAKGSRVESLRQFPNFHISQLTGEFLNYRTRHATLEPYSLVRIH